MAGIPRGCRSGYPYHATWPARFTAGNTMEIEISGYETIAFEFEPGTSSAKAAATPEVAVAVKAEGPVAAAKVERLPGFAGRDPTTHQQGSAQSLRQLRPRRHAE